jgi:hypothetical protein
MVGGDVYKGFFIFLIYILGSFIEDRVEGQGEFIWVNGGKYEGSNLNNKKHGYGILKMASGDVYKGFFIILLIYI